MDPVFANDTTSCRPKAKSNTEKTEHKLNLLTYMNFIKETKKSVF